VSSYAGLTTVRQPLLESGKAAVALLLEALASETPPAPEVHQFGLELVERSTTAPPRAGRAAPGERRRARAAK
jgi:DNA-binding LacI/PurR family transcriptional regulator